MAAIPLTEGAIRVVKRTLRNRFPSDQSAHISEALAAALGFRTNIALVDIVRKVDPQDPDFELLNEQPFLTRLAQLAKRPLTSSDRCLIFDNLPYPQPSPVVPTRSPAWERVNYSKSLRRRAWRNAMVAAINEGIRRRYFTIKPGDNRWPGAERNQYGQANAQVFEFNLDGIPALSSVRDGGYDELSVHVAMWPTADAARWIECINAGWLAGDLYASGWLERRDGAWLQVANSSSLGDAFRCRRHRINQVAALEIAPLGFADRGSFKL
jgi:hypothetical protein